MTDEGRLSASADADLLHARRLAAVDAFLRDYEAEHGEITVAEMDAALYRARGRGAVVDERTAGPRPNA